MLEVTPLAEQGAEELIVFSLTKGLGDRTIRERLHSFQQEGMNGPQATHALLSLFEPLSATEDDLHLLRSGEKKPETLWDQVGWASSNPHMLTPDQKSAFTLLQYFALDSLANTPQAHKLHGEMRELTKETAGVAQRVFEAYDANLQKTLDPDDPTSAKIFDTSGVVAKIGVAVSPLLLSVACGLRLLGPNTKEIPIAASTPTHAPVVSMGEFISIKGAYPEQVSTRNETGSQFRNFETMEDALAYLESESGTTWILGDPMNEITYYPWKTPEAWSVFENLKTIGDQPHFVFLVPNAKGNKFSPIGTESFYGNTLLDFVDVKGNPTTILVKGSLDLKKLLGKNSDILWEKNIMVWPDMSYPSGNCPVQTGSPVPGVTEGFACTVDGKRGHYFQAQSKFGK